MPFFVAPGPASNCGLINAINWAGDPASLSAGGSANFSGMKLTSTLTRLGELAEVVGGNCADVGTIHRDDFMAQMQAFVQLPLADIDRIDAPRPTVQQDLRKSSRGGADIKANPIFRIKAEMVERRREFDAAARNIGMRRACAQLCIHRNLLGRLEHHSLVCGHKAGLDRGLRLRTTLKQTTVDEQSIGALTQRGHGLAR